MKKIIILSVCIVLLSLESGSLLLAQAPTPNPPPAAVPPPAPHSTLNEKTDQTEIVIRKTGEKDTKLTLEIRNGEYFINGKPLDKYEGDDIIVEKKDIAEDEVEAPIPYPVSPFRSDPEDERDMVRAYRNKEMQKSIQKRMDIRMNTAFLGVSSKKSQTGGATVVEVTKGSPAEKAGIQKGDIITKINETPITSTENLFETVHNYKPGDKIKVWFSRNGKQQSVMAVLEKNDPGIQNKYYYHFDMPPVPGEDFAMPDMRNFRMDVNWGPKPKLGMKVQDAETGKGVNILEVEDSSAAATAGLKKGDIILQFDGTDVNSTNELMDLLQDARQKGTVKVKIQRAGMNQEMDLKIPRKLKTAEL